MRERKRENDGFEEVVLVFSEAFANQVD